MKKTELTCIGCPLGCQITVEQDEKGEITSVTGNTCKRGDAYARTEVTAPVRTVTSTIAVKGGAVTVVPCKTKDTIPKGMIFEVMDAIRSTCADAPVKIGDVLIKDVCGTGVDVVATKAVEI